MVLIGFMGAGKTTVGRLISKKLGLNFIDLDTMIESENGAISDIFNQHGEAYFRDLEGNCLANAIQFDRLSVISVGGGILEGTAGFELLSNYSTVVWLKMSFSTVLNRLNKKGRELRPLFDDQVESRFYERQKKYEICSDFTVDVDSMSVESVAEKIINRYG